MGRVLLTCCIIATALIESAHAAGEGEKPRPPIEVRKHEHSAEETEAGLGELLCSYCRDHVLAKDSECSKCTQCGTLMHQECVNEKKSDKCSTIGCEGRMQGRVVAVVPLFTKESLEEIKNFYDAFSSLMRAHLTAGQPIPSNLVDALRDQLWMRNEKLSGELVEEVNRLSRDFPSFRSEILPKITDWIRPGDLDEKELERLSKLEYLSESLQKKVIQVVHRIGRLALIGNLKPPGLDVHREMVNGLAGGSPGPDFAAAAMEFFVRQGKLPGLGFSAAFRPLFEVDWAMAPDTIGIRMEYLRLLEEEFSAKVIEGLLQERKESKKLVWQTRAEYYQLLRQKRDHHLMTYNNREFWEAISRTSKPLRESKLLWTLFGPGNRFVDLEERGMLSFLSRQSRIPKEVQKWVIWEAMSQFSNPSIQKVTIEAFQRTENPVPELVEVFLKKHVLPDPGFWMERIRFGLSNMDHPVFDDSKIQGRLIGWLANSPDALLDPEIRSKLKNWMIRAFESSDSKRVIFFDQMRLRLTSAEFSEVCIEALEEARSIASIWKLPIKGFLRDPAWGPSDSIVGPYPLLRKFSLFRKRVAESDRSAPLLREIAQEVIQADRKSNPLVTFDGDWRRPVAALFAQMLPYGEVIEELRNNYATRPEVREGFESLFSAINVSGRRLGLELLPAINGPMSVEGRHALVKLAGDPDPGIRGLFTERFVSLYEACPEFRQGLLDILGEHVGKTWADVLHPDEMERVSKNAVLKIQLIRLLTQVSNQLTPELRRIIPVLMRDPNPGVREQIALAISVLGAPTRETVAEVLQLLKDPAPQVRSAALDSLHQFPEQAFISNSVMDVFHESWKGKGPLSQTQALELWLIVLADSGLPNVILVLKQIEDRPRVLATLLHLRKNPKTIYEIFLHSLEGKGPFAPNEAAQTLSKRAELLPANELAAELRGINPEILRAIHKLLPLRNKMAKPIAHAAELTRAQCIREALSRPIPNPLRRRSPFAH